MGNRFSLIRENCFHETLQITRSTKIVHLENLVLYGIYMYMYMYMYIHVHCTLYMWLCVHACMHVLCVSLCVHVYIYVHVHVHVYIHVHIYVHVLLLFPLSLSADVESATWLLHQKHVFILSLSGKPIYSR